MKNRLLKFPGAYIIATIIFGGLPFLIYLLERKNGIIPTSEIWYSTGANHGPWRGGWEILIVYYPIVILIITTLITLFSGSVKDKKWVLAVIGLVLAQIAILITQLYFLTWTVD